jgi:hypothetical protein
MQKIRKCPWILPVLCFLSSCAPLYFQTRPEPSQPIQIKHLGGLPFRELWSGFVFNGEKVGFTYLSIDPVENSELFRITSEAHMNILFLGIHKAVHMKTTDLVRPDLTLVSFQYEQKMDDSHLSVEGSVSDGALSLVRREGASTKTLTEKLDEPLYPASATALYPVLHGLRIGAQYSYQVFDPQLLVLARVSQNVESFEESSELSVEPAFRVKTTMHGYEVLSWINRRGETVFELALGGALITYKEDEATAKRFLSEASLNKKDMILDFSLVPTELPLPCPREAKYLEVSLEGLDVQLPVLQGPGQEGMKLKSNSHKETFYRIHAGPGIKDQQPRVEKGFSRFERPSFHIESNHPEISKTASEIISGASTSEKKIARLAVWVSKNVEDEAVESFSALEVLHKRRGECQAHTLLYTALARAAGIPTKLVGGLVYVEDVGFLYHAWAESYDEGWVSVDPTFGQVGVDATHIKLVEGPSWSELLQLGKVIGRIKARVIDYRASYQ